MTEKTIPPKPTDTSPAGFLRWVNQHFPFEEQWRSWVKNRSESEVPEFGTPESLDDLRAISDRDLAVVCANHWWNTFENQDRIIRAHAAARREEQQRERRRLILLAKQALEGKLGETSTARDDARSTAQTFLRQIPEQCSDDDLGDWMKMHQYAKRLASGTRINKPRLASDVRRESAGKREMADFDVAIGAAPAGKPIYRRAEQQGFDGEWTR
jgi:hypothetical protein